MKLNIPKIYPNSVMILNINSNSNSNSKITKYQKFPVKFKFLR